MFYVVNGPCKYYIRVWKFWWVRVNFLGRFIEWHNRGKRMSCIHFPPIWIRREWKLGRCFATPSCQLFSTKINVHVLEWYFCTWKLSLYQHYQIVIQYLKDWRMTLGFWNSSCALCQKGTRRLNYQINSLNLLLKFGPVFPGPFW